MKNNQNAISQLESTICENILRIRKEMKLTQEDFANLIHSKRINVAKWETKLACPSYKTVEEIALALGRDPFSLCRPHYEKQHMLSDEEYQVYLQNDQIRRSLQGLLTLSPQKQNGKLTTCWSDSSPVNRLLHFPQTLALSADRLAPTGSSGYF